jgi:DNA-binding SARP family transcriptional activator/tetratricopeptide (TPR) repeat protein
MVEFRVLGPVEVWAGDRRVDAGQPRQRHVLAALLTDAGRSVTWETLIDRVWGEAPPDGARPAMRAHMSRIRRVLAVVGGATGVPVRLARRGGGYALDVDPDRVDLHRLRRLADQARDPGRAPADRAALLREATRLWRGEPLAGLAGEWPARMRLTWQRERLDVVARWAQAEILIGNADDVIAPLTELVDEHPLAERLAVVLMQALAADGQPAVALEFYVRVRDRLAGELGTNPSPDLHAAYQAILRGELGPPAATRRGPPVPAQLPADVAVFAGRGEELSRLDKLVTGSAPDSTAVVISAVSGAAGVGKTALAVHWAHTVANRFPDGQLYVNLRGFDPSGQMMSPAEALRGFLDALGVPPAGIPASLDTQIARYRSLLAGKRVLVVLDNARDAEHARPLLPGTATALALVTSRNHLTPLVATEGAYAMTLDVLSTEEARDLLMRRLGGDRVAAEPAAVRSVISACGGLPLALSVAAARAQESGFSLAALANELSSVERSLDVLDAGDPTSNVRAVFSWSVEALTPPAARLFRLLSLHPGPDIGAAAAASLAGQPQGQVRRALTELSRASLLVEHLPGRYIVHDLLRAYASYLTTTTDAAADRRAATGRLLDHLIHTGHAADRLLSPHRGAMALPLRPHCPGTHIDEPADAQTAANWFVVEHPALLAAVRQAADAGLDVQAWQLAWCLSTHLFRRGHWRDLATAWELALVVARRLGEPIAQADAHRGLAHTDALLGHGDTARTHLQQAMELSVMVGDQDGQARVEHQLAYILELEGRPAESLHHARRALALHRAGGYLRGQAVALNAVSWCCAQLGRYDEALDHCRQALALYEKLGNRHGQANAWDSRGYIQHHLGEYAEAVDSYQRSLALSRDVGHRVNEAETLSHLGDTHLATGDTAAARTVWREALRILDELDHTYAASVRGKLADLEAEPAGPPT